MALAFLFKKPCNILHSLSILLWILGDGMPCLSLHTSNPCTGDEEEVDMMANPGGKLWRSNLFKLCIQNVKFAIYMP